MAHTYSRIRLPRSGTGLTQRLKDSLLHPSPLTMMGVVALWFTVVCNGALWGTLWPHIAPQGAGALGVVALGAVALTSLQWALLALLAWRPLVKPAASVLLLMAAVCASFMGQYGIVIDPGMMVNVWQTDSLEVNGLLSGYWFASVLVLSVPPIWWVWRTPVRKTTWQKQTLHALLAVPLGLVIGIAALLPIYKETSALMRNDKSLRYRITPSNAVYAALATLRPAKAAGPLLPQGLDAYVAQPVAAGATAATKPRLLVLVVGETARADHFSTNGYARNTTPDLQRPDVFNFSQVRSCGTSTAVSLPCMFSVLGKKAHEASPQRHENVLDVLQRAGYRVLWLDNQAGCKGVCDRVAQAATSAQATPDLCKGGECLDEAMLAGLDDRLRTLLASAPTAPGVVLVMHQMGSHGPEYYRRSPATLKPFLPECQTANFGDCTQEAITNAYDNSIRYTSHFLGLTMQWLQAHTSEFDSAMLYLSDHGESLGENGLYLHSMPYALAPQSQTHVPMIAWFSPAWRQRQPLDEACLRTQAAQAISHDNLSPSLLGLLQVRTSVYQPSLDLFRPCAQHAQAQAQAQLPSNGPAAHALAGSKAPA